MIAHSIISLPVEICQSLLFIYFYFLFFFAETITGPFTIIASVNIVAK